MTKKAIGRPRKPLPGGHRNRTPLPTEDARLKAVVRAMGKAPVKRKSATPASAAQREEGRVQGRRVVLLKKGHHQGRPKEAKSKVPAGVRASVRAILERVVKEKSTTVERAFVDGLNGGPRNADRYLRLAAEYVDGKPTDNVNLNARFNQDELGSAREMLGKKFEGILKVILSTESETK